MELNTFNVQRKFACAIAKYEQHKEAKRRTYLDATGTVGRINQDKQHLAEKEEEIYMRYKGALAGEPIGHGASDNRTGDPERRTIELEKLSNGAVAKRVEAVETAFNDLRAYREKWGDFPESVEKLILAIVASCDNRKKYGFLGLQRAFDLPYSERSFRDYKARVLTKVAETLGL